MTYQMAVNEFSELHLLLERFPKTMVVLDESHNIKKFEGGKWAENVLNLAPYAKRRVVLTGTPAPNSLSDIWTQFTFLWPGMGVLGSRSSFRDKMDREDTLQTLRESLKPFYCRIKKSDLLLPEPIFEVFKVQTGEISKGDL